jgi:hypothetical protein
LKAKIFGKKEVSNGYRYRLAASDTITDELVSFIKTEKQCFDFFGFSLSFVGDDTWLTITGPNSAKEFIKDELDL